MSQSQILAVFQDGYAAGLIVGTATPIVLPVVHVTPPASKGGSPVKQTTMQNQWAHTQLPAVLKEIGSSSVTVAYSSVTLAALYAAQNQNVILTLVWPTGKRLRWWGWIRDIDPQQLAIGTRPEANLTLEASNLNSEGNEVQPLWDENGVTTTTTTAEFEPS